MYELKNLTSDANRELNIGGRGVRPERFFDIDAGMEEQMPRGNKNYIF